MTSQRNGADITLQDQQEETFPDPDEQDNLDLTFDDIIIMDGRDSAVDSTMTNPMPISLNDNDDDDDVCCGKNKTSCSDNDNENYNNMQDEYILGTLIVRVVAARDLNPVVNGGPLGNFFGGGGGGHRHRGNGRGGGGSRGGAGTATGSGSSANPYASVRFGKTIQRTSEVFDSINPIWPRGETMYMDVIHPAFTDKLYEEESQEKEKQAQEEQQQQTSSSASSSSASSSSTSIPPVAPFDFETASSLSREVLSRDQNRQQQQQQQQQPGDPPQKTTATTTTTTTVPPAAAAAAVAPPPVPAAAAAAAASSSTSSSSSSSSSPPRKKTSFENKINNNNSKNKKTTVDDDFKPRLPEKPILTIAIFHANEIGGHLNKYNPTKGGGSSSSSNSGDSDDVFLGMAAVDLTMLLTGKTQTYDAWLPLSGTPDEQSNSHYPRSSVRIVCEYEASDDAPQPGDLVRFTGFCHEADLYPFHAGKLYKVEDPLERNIINKNISNNNSTLAAAHGDLILLSWTSPEGWISSVMVHRFMVVCEHRALHHQGPMEYYQDEIATLTERILVHSPMIHVVQDAYERLPNDGLATITQEVWSGGANLLQRWMQGGIQTIVHDVIHATNVDGHANPTTDESVLDTDDMEDLDVNYENNNNNNAGASSSDETISNDGKSTPKLQLQQQKQQQQQYIPLPNMPACPITGQAMVDPVVAADGHTYERSAIARWLRTSDKSPLTGSVLDHKNLVPNFMLLSSLQEAAAAVAAARAAADQQQHDMTKLHPTSSSTTALAASASTLQQIGSHNEKDIVIDEDLILDDADLLIDEELL